jgi:nucleoside diphosphate kinase
MVATLLAIFSSFSSEMAANNERSFIMVKPDGVQRGLVGEIMKRFEQRGYKLVACKQMQVTRRFIQNKLFKLGILNRYRFVMNARIIYMPSFRIL